MGKNQEEWQLCNDKDLAFEYEQIYSSILQQCEYDQ